MLFYFIATVSALATNLSPSLSPDECGALAEKNGIISGLSWGNSNFEAQQAYFKGMCGSQICHYWNSKYGKDLSAAPVQVQLGFMNPQVNCKKVIEFDIQPDAGCKQLNQAFAPLPPISWGAMPLIFQKLYVNQQCVDSVCSYWKEQYKIVDSNHFGSAPLDVQQAWKAKSCN